MAENLQSKEIELPENDAIDELPFGRKHGDVRETVTRKRTLLKEADDEVSSTTKLMKQTDVCPITERSELTEEKTNNPSQHSSPASTMTFPFRRSDSEEDLNDEEVALLMAAPPKMQGNQSAKNSPSGDQDSTVNTSDEGSAGSEITAPNTSPANDVAAKNDDTSD